ncbi:MAG: 16S rRNA (guanine(966)-N(2))-methyltransferase RsmD [Proteobacteria bacterium]|nr:16S rRNA (guanine(966)-N(2))-methyltransferase RsmD [Pseudomonadota bacterium]
MRIAAGEFRSRKIVAPPGDDIRPTSDMMRQVIFNMLQKYGLPADAIVLDAFCGTGALGLEALSRGAASCVFIDKSRKSIDCCRENIASLKVDGKTRTVHRDVLTPGSAEAPPASLVFLDPPYRKDFIAPALAALAACGWIAPGAVCVAEAEEGACPAAPEEFALLNSRSHGGTEIFFYRYAG